MTMRKFNPGQMKAIILQHGLTCYWCHAPLKSVVIDHYVPYSRGGPTEIFNGVPSCVRCNEEKDAMMPDKYRHLIDNRNAKGRPVRLLPPRHVHEQEPKTDHWRNRLHNALRMLDEHNEDHWNDGCLPSAGQTSFFMKEHVTPSQILHHFPDFVRGG